MHRFVAHFLLALLLVQGVTPARAMACATDEPALPGVADDAMPAHAHHQAPSSAAQEDAADKPPAEPGTPVPAHDAGHCLMAACFAPALATAAQSTAGHELPAGDVAAVTVMAPRSAAPAPDTPPPRC